VLLKGHKIGPDMPSDMQFGHCIVKINETFLFMIGGYSKTNIYLVTENTYFVNLATKHDTHKWILGPKLTIGRYKHDSPLGGTSCGSRQLKQFTKKNQ
jgi:hypothetical protein